MGRMDIFLKNIYPKPYSIYLRGTIGLRALVHKPYLGPPMQVPLKVGMVSAHDCSCSAQKGTTWEDVAIVPLK